MKINAYWTTNVGHCTVCTFFCHWLCSRQPKMSSNEVPSRVEILPPKMVVLHTAPWPLDSTTSRGCWLCTQPCPLFLSTSLFCLDTFVQAAMEHLEKVVISTCFSLLAILLRIALSSRVELFGFFLFCMQAFVFLFQKQSIRLREMKWIVQPEPLQVEPLKYPSLPSNSLFDRDKCTSIVGSTEVRVGSTACVRKDVSCFSPRWK